MGAGVGSVSFPGDGARQQGGSHGLLLLAAHRSLLRVESLRSRQGTLGLWVEPLGAALFVVVQQLIRLRLYTLASRVLELVGLYATGHAVCWP